MIARSIAGGGGGGTNITGAVNITGKNGAAVGVASAASARATPATSRWASRETSSRKDSVQRLARAVGGGGGGNSGTNITGALAFSNSSGGSSRTALWRGSAASAATPARPGAWTSPTTAPSSPCARAGTLRIDPITHLLVPAHLALKDGTDRTALPRSRLAAAARGRPQCGGGIAYARGQGDAAWWSVSAVRRSGGAPTTSR